MSSRDDLAAFGPRLMRHQGHPVDLRRQRIGLARIPGELHAAALAAPSCVNLRLDDDGSAAKSLGDAFGVSRLQDGLAPRNGHAVLRKDMFGLILVNFHMRETVNRIIFSRTAQRAAPLFVGAGRLRIEFKT